MGKEVSGRSQTPVHVQATSSGNTTVVTPSSGQKIRLYYYSVAAKPSNSADVTVGLRWTTSGTDFFSQVLSQYGGANASNLGDSWIDGGTDQSLEVNLDASQVVDVNIRYEEVA